MRPCDVLFLTVPLMQMLAPLVGPSLLKAKLESCTSHNVLCHDLNMDLYSRLDPLRHSDIVDNLLHGINSVVFDTDFEDEYNTFHDDFYGKVLDQWADEIIATGARWVGFTAFVNGSLFTIRDLSERLKARNPHIITIMGGAAADPIRTREQSIHASRLLMWVDHIVMGDGENIIVDIVEDNVGFQHVHRPPAVSMLDNPFPDYSDYDLSRYSSLYITGSRGCVRQCTFCEIPNIFGKFRSKPGERIVREMFYQWQRYPIGRFHFTDSLINGSMKYFVEFIEELAALKRVWPDFNSVWDSHFIVRRPEVMRPEYFVTMKAAGCHMVKIGAESGSERIRVLMKKEYSQSELDYTVDQLLANNILILFSIIVGHPDETEADFQATLDMFKRYCAHANRFVVSVHTMGIREGIPLWGWAKEHTTLDDKGQWVYGDNNLRLRAGRLNRFLVELATMGYDVGDTKFSDDAPPWAPSFSRTQSTTHGNVKIKKNERLLGA